MDEIRIDRPLDPGLDQLIGQDKLPQVQYFGNLGT
jgi:hypothetical protein